MILIPFCRPTGLRFALVSTSCSRQRQHRTGRSLRRSRTLAGRRTTQYSGLCHHMCWRERWIQAGSFWRRWKQRQPVASIPEHKQGKNFKNCSVSLAVMCFHTLTRKRLMDLCTENLSRFSPGTDGHDISMRPFFKKKQGGGLRIFNDVTAYLWFNCFAKCSNLAFAILPGSSRAAEKRL